MRGVIAFLVWLFSLWTWKKLCVGRVKAPSLQLASGDTAGAEPLRSNEGQHESELAHFLSSLPEDERCCRELWFHGDKVTMWFGPSYEWTFKANMQKGYGEFVAAVASSKVVCSESFQIALWVGDFYKQIEGIVDALRHSGNDFRKLSLQFRKGSAIRISTFVSNVLLGNNGIQDLHMCFKLDEVLGKEVASKFMTIALPCNIQILTSFDFFMPKLDGEGMEHVIQSLMGPHNALKELRIGPITSDIHLEYISDMLAKSTTLRYLYLKKHPDHIKPCIRGYTFISKALCTNQSLKSLCCRISSSKELKALLDPLMPMENNHQHNTTLTTLTLSGKIGGNQGVETLVDMLHTNTSLLQLTLFEIEELYSKDHDVIENTIAILEALKTNKSLKEISFFSCEGVGGYKVLGTMMDLLLKNHCIENIDLLRTGLEKSGDAEYVSFALLKKKKMNLWNIVLGMANENPTSSRVFLCGEPYAGKTTLRMSMKQWIETQKKEEIRISQRFGKMFRKKIKSPKDMKIPQIQMLNERTRGIEVDNVFNDGIGITIWDMAGQSDYHSFHELMMPNLSADGSSSFFLLMCNPMQQTSPWKKRRPSKIKLEIESWLRFIASNTRRSQSYPPHVSIVMTHYDYWEDDVEFAERIGDVVLELKSQFQEVLEFDESKFVFKVDGTNVSHARVVFNFIKTYLKALLQRLPKTIRACQEVQHRIKEWNVRFSNQPVLQWDEFCENICKEVEELNDIDDDLAKRRKEFVAISLNDGGHIIYNEEGGVVITNPHWFCHDIMGQFLQWCTKKGQELEMVSRNGIISIDHLKRFLLKLVEGQGDMKKLFDDILCIMEKLHVCYKQDDDHILIPSILEDKHQSLNWCQNLDSISFTYVGRRLACKDDIRTMLSPRFFARLQVSFFEKFQNNNVRDSYELFLNIIKFICNGIEVIIQFHDGDIDILLRSHHCQYIMLEFLENDIVRHIKNLQSDPTLGCPGVLLEEFILRPTCVKKLINLKLRKNQVVSMKNLEMSVMTNGISAVHNWKKCEGLGVGYDKVKILLGDMAWTKFLERRSHDLQRYHKEISLTTLNQNDPISCKDEKDDSLWNTSNWLQIPQKLRTPFRRNHSYSHWEEVKDKLDNMDKNLDKMDKKMDDNHKEVMTKLDVVAQSLEKNIVTLQNNLLYEVCSRIDDLMAFSMEMQKSQIPKLPYFTKSEKKELLIQLVPNLKILQLHLLCENRHGFHEVVDQEGYKVKISTQSTRRFLNMLDWGLKIVTILIKIGAHMGAGMGGMVPDFSDGGNFAALILDTPGLLPNYQSLIVKIDGESQLEAEEGFRDILEPLCTEKREFYKTFKLKKVSYKIASRSIAWICDTCITKEGDQIDILH